MKLSYVIFSIFTIIILFFSLYWFLNLENEDMNSMVYTPVKWRIKKREIKSRLFSTPILLYHNIDGKGVFSLPSKTLSSQFEMFIDKKINVISLEQLVKRIEIPKPFNQKAIAITFDDGFPSMYHQLLPLASKFGYPITLFVYIDFIFTKSKRNLTWELLRKMEKKGISIECHTISHPDLNEISKENTPESKRKLFEEIYLSKRIIELYMKKNVKYFAFPYGRYSLKIIELCQFAGYQRVFSTDYGSNIITRDNYCLKRTHVKNTFPLRLIEKFVK
ncbi:MAG: polysaccharide deacetylase family protein [Spirochaetota bacterium]|nr:polysaccharide deacetylase family protein [Spirochaetota bacterium]